MPHQSRKLALLILVLLVTAAAPPASGQPSLSTFVIVESQMLEVSGVGSLVEIASGSNNGSGGVVSRILFSTVTGFGALNYFSLGLERLQFQEFGEIHFTTSTSGAEVPLRAVESGLVLASDNRSQRYLADADDDDALANHIWYEDKVGAPSDPVDTRMMQLTEEMGGTLYVDGPVVQNHTFDLAETFWEAEPVEAGELVAIHSGRPMSVRRSQTAYEATLLGVASANPGFLLGGAPFSLAALRETWGDEIAAAYLSQRPELELAVYAELPRLAAEAGRLVSEGGFQQWALSEEQRRSAAERAAGGQSREPAPPPTATEWTVAYQAALADHETTMRDRTLRLFFRRHFSAVALAGRVPVKVDASYGAIRPGDPLTSSPTPGVAMRATAAGPVIGSALEAHAQGEGVIEVFVHRGWYGGGSAATAVGLAHAAPPDPRDAEIERLTSRLAALEARLEQVLVGPRAAATPASP